MAAMIEQRKGANGAVHHSVDFDDLAPRTHVLFANAVVGSMCDEFNVYWEPEVSQGYRNFRGLARHARISDYVLRAIRIIFLAHNRFEKTAEDLATRGFELENLSYFIDEQIQSLLLMRGEKSMRRVLYVLACVSGVCVSLYQSGWDFAPSLCAVKLGKMMQALGKEWKGDLYFRLDDFARDLVWPEQQSQEIQLLHMLQPLEIY